MNISNINQSNSMKDALPYQNQSTATTLKNSYFVWINATILFLTAVPIVCALVSMFAHIPLWTVPKIYELKIYLLAMLAAAALSFLARYKPLIFTREYQFYYRYIALFLPIAALIYTSSFPSLDRYLWVFLLALLGLYILRHSYHSAFQQESLPQTKADHWALSISIVFTILFIITRSNLNTFNIMSFWTIVIFLLILSILKFINLSTLITSILVSILIFLASFVTPNYIDNMNYNFFLGPVIQVLYGHQHPLMVDAQYGGGLTGFLALYFYPQRFISYGSLQLLLKSLTFLQFSLIFAIAVSLYRSYILALLTLLATLVYSFYSQGIYYYAAPSIGFLRFGFIYLIIFIYILREKNFLKEKFALYMIAIFSSVAFLWSFESAVYTLPAVFVAEIANKNLRKFIPIFLTCFLVIISGYVVYFFLYHRIPPFAHYYEYALLYANGLGQIPLSREISFWWLFPLLYGFLLMRIFLGQISDNRVIALTIYGIMLFTYYGGRAHPNNIHHIAIPFILLSIYVIWRWQNTPFYLKQIFTAAALTVFFTANYSYVNKGMIIEGIPSQFLSAWQTIKTTNLFFPNYDDLDGKAVIQDCSADYTSIKKYIYNNSIALLSDNLNSYHLYVCARIFNAFNTNPYVETAFNPKAVQRAELRANSLANSYILVDSELLNRARQDQWGSDLTARLLQITHAVKIGHIMIDSMDIIIFRKV